MKTDEERRISQCEASKRWYEKNRDRAKKYHRQWLRDNKNKSREYVWRQNGIEMTHSEYQEMLVAQDGKCAICGGNRSSTHALAVDHDHNTGQLRELLCIKCNLLISAADDDTECLESAWLYLNKHKRKEVI